MPKPKNSKPCEVFNQLLCWGFGEPNTSQGFFYGVFPMKNNDLQKEQAHLFNFGCAPIRAQIDTIGMPWFNANDVCEALYLMNPRDAIAKHVDSDDVAKRDTIDSMGRTQQVNHINESGLYALIFGSTKPEALMPRQYA